MTSENENEEMAWLYYLPVMTAEEEQEAAQEATIYFNPEMLNLEREASNESFSDLLPPRPLRLSELFDAAATNDQLAENNDDDFMPFIQPQLNVTYVPFVSEESDSTDETTCFICLEDCPRKSLVHFREEWMVGRRCCMQNSMCEACFINTIRYKPNQTVCCPFCRHPISHIETHNPEFNNMAGEYLQIG